MMRMGRMGRVFAGIAGLCALLCTATLAQAAGFRSVSEVAILYDSPSTKGSKLFIAPAGMPVQVVVGLDAWVKVRDAAGGLAWIERKALDDKRTVVTTVATRVRQAPSDMAAEVFQIRPGVLLDLIEPPATSTSVPPRTPGTTPEGWAQVRHADGQSGYIKASEVWGL